MTMRITIFTVLTWVLQILLRRFSLDYGNELMLAWKLADHYIGVNVTVPCCSMC